MEHLNTNNPSLDPVDMTIDRFSNKQEQVAAGFGWGETEGGLAIIRGYLKDYLTIFKEGLKRVPKELRGNPRDMVSLDVELITVASIHVAIGAIAKTQDLSGSMRDIGKQIYYELYGQALYDWDKAKATQIVQRAKGRNNRVKQRLSSVRSMARQAGFKFERWSDSDNLRAGGFLVGLLTEGGAFMIVYPEVGSPYLTLTEEAMAISDKFVEYMVTQHPLNMPMLEPPAPWTQPTQLIDGLPRDFVRHHSSKVQRAIKQAFEDQSILPAVDAVNAAQAVSFRINIPVLSVLDWCVANDVHVPGLPRMSDLPMPPHPKPWDEMTEDEQKVWKKKAYDTTSSNRGFIGERIALQRDLCTAHWIEDRPFWVPHSADYRGRVYGIPFFQFQRSDHIRGLFEFQAGRVLTEEGLYWLKVHLANCGDFDKISKRSFAERVAWVDQNIEAITGFSHDPFNNDMWMEADKPFMFLAACMAFKDGLEGLPVHLPVSFDGSCSGLQHLCAMMRSEEGTLVNLTPTEEPQDVYQTVADRAARIVALDHSDIAHVVRDVGINRSLVKRNVMTYSYSSKKFGMAHQHLEDTMRPLAMEVLEGKRSSHPYGDDDGYLAARYLAQVVYAAIEDTVSKPAEAMRFLQGIARAMAHEGKPVKWTTPLGFPCVLAYPNQSIRRVSLFLHDRGVRSTYSPASTVEERGIDKKKAASAISPSFVHSMDGCHLQMVVNAATSEGITDVALVHDSFGCHPNDAPRFRDIIREQFYLLYHENDVLLNIQREAFLQIDTNAGRIPKVPQYGRLDLTQILRSDYAFA